MTIQQQLFSIARYADPRRLRHKLSHLAAVLALLTCQCLAGDTLGSHGTILVVQFYDGRILVGADSRSSGSGISLEDRDKECKITPLGDKAFFAMAGKAKAFDATNRNTVLVDSHAAAKLAYSELSAGSTATPDVKAIADRWAKVMVSEYTECSLNCREIPLALQRNTRIVPVFYDSSSTNRTGENGLLSSEERHCPGFSLEGTCAVRFPVGH